MIPEYENILDLELVSQPSLTYKLDLQRGRIGSKIDNEQAIQQAVMKILNTERYAYVIYSSQYGVELQRLIGKDYNFVVADLQRTITEALLADDRILEVVNFDVEQTGKDSLTARFEVISVVGTANITTGVQIA